LEPGLTRLAHYSFPVQLNDVTRAYFERSAGIEKPEMAAAMRALLKNPADAKAAATLSTFSRIIVMSSCCGASPTNAAISRSMRSRVALRAGLLLRAYLAAAGPLFRAHDRAAGKLPRHRLTTRAAGYVVDRCTSAAGGDAMVAGGLQQALADRGGGGRARGEPRRESAGLLEQDGRGQDPVHHAPAVHLGGRVDVAGHDQFGGPRHTGPCPGTSTSVSSIANADRLRTQPAWSWLKTLFSS